MVASHICLTHSHVSLQAKRITWASR
jgi:hypothetical protein